MMPDFIGFVISLTLIAIYIFLLRKISKYDIDALQSSDKNQARTAKDLYSDYFDLNTEAFEAYQELIRESYNATNKHKY